MKNLAKFFGFVFVLILLLSASCGRLNVPDVSGQWYVYYYALPPQSGDPDLFGDWLFLPVGAAVMNFVQENKKIIIECEADTLNCNLVEKDGNWRLEGKQDNGSSVREISLEMNDEVITGCVTITNKTNPDDRTKIHYQFLKINRLPDLNDLPPISGSYQYKTTITCSPYYVVSQGKVSFLKTDDNKIDIVFDNGKKFQGEIIKLGQDYYIYYRESISAGKNYFHYFFRVYLDGRIGGFVYPMGGKDFESAQPINFFRAEKLQP